MLFVSWSFAVFLPIVFALHYWGRRLGWQVGVLIVASFVFYGWANPKLIPLLAVACLVNSFASAELLAAGRSREQRRRTLILTLVFNLGTLAFFKYAALLGDLFLPAWLSERWGGWLSDIPLPIGISFFTFQGISLVVDCWYVGNQGFPGLTPVTTRTDLKSHVAKVTFFKAFFPALIAGPIVKASQFFFQIGPKRLRDIHWDAAIKTLILGFFLKMVVADNLKEVTAGIRYPDFLELPRINLIALVYAFSFQLLADFAGYSIIAIGLGRLFGYELPVNFHFPYLSRSITEFWRRWHMTLSSWLREYLYIPLGGNRRGEFMTYRNLFLVMFLGGLWHGAAWSYAVWGTAHGVLLAGERFFFRQHRAPLEECWSVGAVLRVLAIFTVVTFLWLLFQLREFRHAVEYLRCIATHDGAPQLQALFVITLFSLPVVLWHVWGALENVRKNWAPRTQQTLGMVAHALMLFLIATNAGPPGAFIYFQF